MFQLLRFDNVSTEDLEGKGEIGALDTVFMLVWIPSCCVFFQSPAVRSPAKKKHCGWILAVKMLVFHWHDGFHVRAYIHGDLQSVVRF